MVYPGPTDPYFLAIILIPEPHFPISNVPRPGNSMDRNLIMRKNIVIRDQFRPCNKSDP